MCMCESEEYLPAELVVPENLRKLSYLYHDSEEEEEEEEEGYVVRKMHVFAMLVDGNFHRYDKPNCFFAEPMVIPSECKIRDVSAFCINRMVGKIFNPGECTCDSDNSITYLTEDNGTKSYKIKIIDERLVEVYSYSEEIIPDEIECVSCLLSKLLAEYEPEKIFIGRSLLNNMTAFSGGYGEEWDGNSVLLYMGRSGDNYEYIYIGMNIISLSTSEEVLEYYSPVGNSCVPYPYCLTENYIYDFCYGLYHRDDVHDRGNEGIDYEEHEFLRPLPNADIINDKELFPRPTPNWAFGGWYTSSKNISDICEQYYIPPGTST